MSSFDFFKNHLKIQAFQTLKTILASRHETGSRLCPTAAAFLFGGLLHICMFVEERF